MSNLASTSVAHRYTYRPATFDDLPAVHALLQAIVAIEPDDYAATLEDVQRDYADPWCDPPVDTRLAFAPDGRLVAYARIIANPDPLREVRAYLLDDIHPAHRSDALEEALLDWRIARGTERVRAIAAANPGRAPLLLRYSCWDSEQERIARCQRRGFRPARYMYRMRRDLRQPVPDRPLPAGLALAAYSPGLDERIRQAHNEAFSDLPNHEPASPGDWQQFMVQRSTFRADLSFAVLDGEEVAAFSMNRYDAAEGERTGFPAGWIGSLGTRRAWRGRGLASALLVHSMRAFQAAGLEYAGLGVDAANPTGALRLYEQLGFAPYLTTIVLQKAVDG